MAKPKYVISLQSTQGISPPVTFTVTGAKADKLFDLLRNDLEKHNKNSQPVSSTLEPFFGEEN